MSQYIFNLLVRRLIALNGWVLPFVLVFIYHIENYKQKEVSEKQLFYIYIKWPKSLIDSLKELLSFSASCCTTFSACFGFYHEIVHANFGYIFYLIMVLPGNTNRCPSGPTLSVAVLCIFVYKTSWCVLNSGNE